MMIVQVVEHDTPIRGDLFETALTQFKPLDKTFKLLFVKALKNAGITLDQHHYHYSEKQLERALRETFGSQITPQLVKMLENGLQKYCINKERKRGARVTPFLSYA